MLDLEPIKNRLAAVTPGPWIVHPMYPRRLTTKASPTMSLLALDVDEYAIVEDEHDAQLIADAPAYLVALVAEVERLREGLDEIACEPWTAGGAEDAVTIARRYLYAPSHAKGATDAEA